MVMSAAVRDAVNAAIVASGNDAAVALAEKIAGS
jgi:D-alanyl-D-alanine carboxypeptidase